MTAIAQRAQIDIVSAIKDPRLIGDVLSPAQEAALRALYGLPLDRDHSALVARCTGRPPETREYREAAFICGRRSGKSDRIAANTAIYEAFFRKHKLSAGERGIVLLMAINVRQAGVVSNYIRGKIERSPILSQHVVATRSLELELDNGISIQVHPSSFRSIRGLSVVACICDEIGFWWTESEYSNPDVEVLRAVRPAMATFPNAKLILVSSPYSKSGVLWEHWQARFDDPDVLVWHAPTALMNPTVTPAFLAKERQRDPEIFEREFEAMFTDAVTSFLPSEAIQRCTITGRTSVPFDDQSGYVVTIDAAFKGDKFTLAVAHKDAVTGRVIIDHLEAWQGSKTAPVALSVVLPRIKQIADRYRVGRITGDQFGAEPLRHAFQSVGLAFEEKPFTVQTKSDIYANLRSLIIDGAIELLDYPDAIRELRALELEALPGGNSRIGHPRRQGASDDYADVIALAALEVVRGRGSRAFGPNDCVFGSVSEFMRGGLYGDPLEPQYRMRDEDDEPLGPGWITIDIPDRRLR